MCRYREMIVWCDEAEVNLIVLFLLSQQFASDYIYFIK